MLNVVRPLQELIKVERENSKVHVIHMYFTVTEGKRDL